MLQDLQVYNAPNTAVRLYPVVEWQWMVPHLHMLCWLSTSSMEVSLESLVAVIFSSSLELPGQAEPYPILCGIMAHMAPLCGSDRFS